MLHPYTNLPGKAFWKTGVSEVGFLDLKDVYRRKFVVSPTDRIVTAGSCFAQHISKKLVSSGFEFVDHEPAPADLPAKDALEFGYGVYSARYANVYTARQLLQLFQRAFGTFTPEETVWEQKGRFLDPFRPQIEPSGFPSMIEFDASRESHLAAVRKVFTESDLFIFTLGLTEAWISKADGAVFPMCPGTVGGVFDAARYEFHNFSVSEILNDLKEVIRLAREQNPGLKFLFTVSPVPLTATASKDHVLIASIYSKSVLRAAAGELEKGDPLIDYYPSYELVASHPSRACLYEPNLRSVSPRGVDTVMRYFFEEHKNNEAPANKTEVAATKKKDAKTLHVDDLLCEEMMLEEFAK